MRARTRGFTLVELLIAMSLFLVLGTALVALLSKAMDFMGSGASGTEVLDKAADFLGPFQADLENVVVERTHNPGAPVVRFYSDFVPLSSSKDGKTEAANCQMLCLEDNRLKGAI
jgi:prepilin-type N-terminal cleavage/methylation domain-containing protein